MALSVEEVRRIADLARLRLTAEEEERFALQLGEIVAYIDQLSGFATAPEEDGQTAVAEVQDAVRAPPPQEDLLANAPARLDSFFVVPQVKAPGDG